MGRVSQMPSLRQRRVGSLATTVPEESNAIRGRSPKAVELPQDSAQAQRSSHARTRASDGALQLQERTAQTICPLPTIARPRHLPNELGGERARMFERYTEKARRVIFFARYEAS